MQRLIFQTFNIHVETASIFFRAMIKGEMYYSRLYRRAKVRNSYTVEYRDHGRFGFIEHFISLKSHTAVIITPLTPTEDYCYPKTFHALRTRIIIPVWVESSVSFILSSCHMCMSFSLRGNPNITQPYTH